MQYNTMQLKYKIKLSYFYFLIECAEPSFCINIHGESHSLLCGLPEGEDNQQCSRCDALQKQPAFQLGQQLAFSTLCATTGSKIQSAKSKNCHEIWSHRNMTKSKRDRWRT